DRAWPYRGKDVLAGSDVVVKARFVNQRLAPVPMEPGAILAVPEDGGLEMWIPCQAPFWMRDEIADSLGLDLDRARAVAPAARGVDGVARVDFEAGSVVTKTTPVDSYRGAGRPEATALIERAIDMVAGELGLDPAEVRRRNFIPKEAFPVRTVTDANYDSGDY